MVALGFGRKGLGQRAGKKVVHASEILPTIYYVRSAALARSFVWSLVALDSRWVGRALLGRVYNINAKASGLCLLICYPSRVVSRVVSRAYSIVLITVYSSDGTAVAATRESVP